MYAYMQKWSPQCDIFCMYMYVCVCVYIYVCVCVYACMHVRTYACMHACKRMSVCIPMLIERDIHMFEYLYVCMCVYIYVFMYTYKYITKNSNH